MLDLVEPGSLMADSTTVPARFVYGASGLGKSLDPGSASRNVEADAQVDAPLWLVKPLLERHMVAATPPVVYGERYQRKLNAGADCVSLRNLVRGRGAAFDRGGAGVRAGRCGAATPRQVAAVLPHGPLNCTARPSGTQRHRQRDTPPLAAAASPLRLRLV